MKPAFRSRIRSYGFHACSIFPKLPRSNLASIPVRVRITCAASSFLQIFQPGCKETRSVHPGWAWKSPVQDMAIFSPTPTTRQPERDPRTRSINIPPSFPLSEQMSFGHLSLIPSTPSVSRSRANATSIHRPSVSSCVRHGCAGHRIDRYRLTPGGDHQ